MVTDPNGSRRVWFGERRDGDVWRAYVTVERGIVRRRKV